MINLQELVQTEWFQLGLGIFTVVLLAQVFLLLLKRWLKKLGKTSGPFLSASKFLVWALVILVVLSNLGYNISSLIAGLGITGIALALAAQETLSNAFGSLSILADKPFKVGDHIRVDQYEGKVLNIGLRSTRLQTEKNSVVSIPNKMVASLPVENLSQ